ncbi:type VII secretion target [Pseudonocardia bannensis]|uniref:Excreted virulence factor EspC (Type VII ESX diderm) n=1 Tax=Pseudonocardia bannensis TaxID=630973 RepID=A0A848DFB8_9PSEU|nr:hypothetical protein [Pseudonocardia bannensis]NMH91332.1 hypothetical protein [Pseudonocardia bannensis]
MGHDGFAVHTDAMRAHASRLREAAGRFDRAGDTAAAITLRSDAFGLIGTALAGDALALAAAAADGLGGQAALVDLAARGIDGMAAAYDEVERRIRDGFGR